MLYSKSAHYQPLVPDPSQVIHDLAPLVAYNNTQPLMDETLWEINVNETTVQSTTVQAHVEDTYTPGDRLDEPKSRRLTHRRQAPRAGGFPCRHQDCGKIFDRACELK